MAKKRLNKKLVVILALTGIPLLLLMIIAVDTSVQQILPGPAHQTLLRLFNRDPLELEKQAEALVKTIEKTKKEIDAKVASEKNIQKAFVLRRQLEDDQLIPLWTEALGKIGGAFAYFKEDLEQKKRMLLRQEELRVMAAKVGDQDWRQEQLKGLLGVWNAQIKMAPTDYAAKKRIVEFFYTQAKERSYSWGQLISDADKLIEIDPDNYYGHMVRGHCDLARIGRGIDISNSKARDFLDKAFQLNNKDVEVLGLMARLCQLEANLNEDEDEKLRLKKASEEYLGQAIKYHPDSPEAYLNLLDYHLLRNVQNAYIALAGPQQDNLRQSQRASAAQQEAEMFSKQASSTQDAVEKKRLESQTQYKADEYKRLITEVELKKVQVEKLLALAIKEKEKVVAILDGWIAERFSKDARFYDRKAGVYAYLLNTQNIATTTELIGLYDKAIACEPDKAEYLGKQAQYYIMQSEYAESPNSDLEKAYQLLRQAQFSSDAAIPTGVHRAKLTEVQFSFIFKQLIDVSTKLAKLSDDAQVAKNYLATANAIYKEIELKFDRNNPYVKLYMQLARGMIDLADDKEQSGLKLLYETHEYFADQKERDQDVPVDLFNKTKRELFKVLHKRPRKVMAIQYAGETRFWRQRPGQDVVNLLEALISTKTDSNKKNAVSLADYYLQDTEQIKYWRDQVKLIKARAMLQLKQHDEVVGLLKELNSNSIEARLIYVQATKDVEEQIKLLKQIMVDFPDDKRPIISLLQYYLTQGRANNSFYKQAKLLVAKELKRDSEVFEYRRVMDILSEPGALPHAIGKGRLFEIEVAVRQATKDPLERFRSLGLFYFNNARRIQLDAKATLAQAKTDIDRMQAKEQAERAEELWAKAREAFQETVGLETDDDRSAYGHLFRVAISNENWDVAQGIVKKIKAQDETLGLLAQAQLLSDRKQWEQAVTAWKSYLDKAPISYQGHQSLAKSYYELNQPQKALDEARIASKQAPANYGIRQLITELQHAVAIKSSKGIVRHAAMLKKSEMHIANGDLGIQNSRDDYAKEEYGKAKKELDSIISGNPENLEAQTIMRSVKVKLGYIAVRQTQYEKALAYAQEVLAVEPDNKAAGLIKCESLFFSDQYKLAEETLLNFQKNKSAGRGFGQVLLAKIYWQMNRKDDAISQLQEAHKANLSSMEIIRLLGQMYTDRERWSDMEKLYDNLLDKYPDAIDLYYYACRIAWTQNKNDQALNYMRRGYAKSIQTEKNVQIVLKQLLQAMIKAKRYTEAISLIDQNIKGNISDILLLMYKAEATWRMGNGREALAIYHKALIRTRTESPASVASVIDNVISIGDSDEIQAWASDIIKSQKELVDMYQIIAKLYRSKGKIGNEIEALEKARKSASTEDDLFIIQHKLAIANMAVKNTSKAIEYNRLILKSRPKDVNILNNLAYTLMEEGGHDKEAMGIAQEAYKLSPNNPMVLDTLALSMINNKEYDTAKTCSLKAIQIMQRHGKEVLPELEYRLGQAMVGQNQKDEAKKRLEPVLERLQKAIDVENNAMWHKKITDLIK